MGWKQQRPGRIVMVGWPTDQRSWTYIALITSALVAYATGADVSVSSATENGAEAATPTPVQRRLGDDCDPDAPIGDDCSSIPGAFCSPDSNKCACKAGMISDTERERCEPPAALGDNCRFDEQCGATTLSTVCINGVCRCSEGLVAITGRAEGAICIEPGQRRLGEACQDIKECGAPNSFCQPGKDVCACLPEYNVTDTIRQCGKAVAWNETCIFQEQCMATNENMTCREGRCICKFQMEAIRQGGKFINCRGGQLKYGDRCENASQCGFDHGVCEKRGAKQMCLCHPDYAITNHLDMCGKPAKINESCEFSAQCEVTTERTECRDGRCVCRFQMSVLYNSDGTVQCVG